MLREEFRFASEFLRRRLLRLSLLFVGLLLPLWGFAELADEVREREPFPFDEPILRFAHALAGDGLDRVSVFFSAVGYRYGVVPFDIALILALAWRRRMREGRYLESCSQCGKLNQNDKLSRRFRERFGEEAWRAVTGRGGGRVPVVEPGPRVVRRGLPVLP